jgi:hypothetical protein
MSEEKSVSVQVGPGFLGLLTILFVALKLTGHIDWSWLWVLSPLWGPITLVFGTAALVLCLAGGVILVMSVYECLLGSTGKSKSKREEE